MAGDLPVAKPSEGGVVTRAVRRHVGTSFVESSTARWRLKGGRQFPFQQLSGVAVRFLHFGCRRQQSPGVRVKRGFKDDFLFPLFHGFPQIHDHEVICNMPDHAQVV